MQFSFLTTCFILCSSECYRTIILKRFLSRPWRTSGTFSLCEHAPPSAKACLWSALVVSNNIVLLSYGKQVCLYLEILPLLDDRLTIFDAKLHFLVYFILFVYVLTVQKYSHEGGKTKNIHKQLKTCFFVVKSRTPLMQFSYGVYKCGQRVGNGTVFVCQCRTHRHAHTLQEKQIYIYIQYMHFRAFLLFGLRQ